MNSKNKRKCGIVSFEIIGNIWNIIIIWSLSNQTLRFTELQKRMNNVNPKTITKHLRILEENNIINRVMYPEVPPRVEYSLTDHGKALIPLLKEIKEWEDSIH